MEKTLPFNNQMPAERCPVCKSGPRNCLPTCTLCKTCWLLPEECKCQNQSAQSFNMSSSGPFTLKEPPNYATVQGDQRKLTQYIAALKLWAKVGGVEKKNQADCIKYNAFQFSPDYFDELNARFGESLSENEDGVNHIIAFLEEKFGVNQHTEIVRKLNVFYSCSRSKNEDLVKYTSRFEQAYTECTKIKVAGSKAIINYSSTALAVLLLRTANLSDVDHQIIARSLNFDEATETEEKKTFERTKAAVIAHQVTKSANHQALQGVSTPRDSNNLATFLAQELELDLEGQCDNNELLNDLRVFITDRRNQGGGKFKQGKQRKRWKCDYCICSHPKWDHSCGCACTKHTKDNCPNPDPEKKRKADLAEKKRQQTGTNPAGTMLVQELSTTPTSALPPNLYAYLNQVDKTFMISPKELPQATTPFPRAALFKELERLETEIQPLLAGSTAPLPIPRLEPLLSRAVGPISGESQNISKTEINICSSHDTIPHNEIENKSSMTGNQNRKILANLEMLVHTTIPSAVYLEGRRISSHSTDPKQIPMVVDTASPSTIIGKDTFARLRATYPAAVSRAFEYQDSVKRFEF